MTRRMLTATLIVLFAAFHGQGEAAPAPGKPKLAVVLVVDQMRSDYLSRFAGVFQHGFARLLEEGAVFTQAYHDHAYTVTAAGHAVLSTGCHPARHGVVGNYLYDRKSWQRVYATLDNDAPVLGYPEKPGRSPRQLLCSTVGDWLKTSSPESKVFGVGRKDRAAILSAGHQADAAYWYNTDDGNMVTSRYYLEDYPRWVDEFNRKRSVDRYFEEGWHKFAPEEVYFLAREDSFQVEGDSTQSTFPYGFRAYSPTPDTTYYHLLAATPFADELVLEFSRALVEHEKLGADDAPDLLFVDLSAADGIGHTFGPLSQEVLDHFLRLDTYLGDFFDFLDQKVGRQNYVVALSSDHGVLTMPEELQRRGVDAKRIDPTEMLLHLQRAGYRAAQTLGLKRNPIVGLSGSGVLLNYAAAKAAGIDSAKLEARLAETLRDLPFVADVFTRTELTAEHSDGRAFQTLFANSFHPQRSPDLTIRIKKHYLTHGPYGTSHGSPYEYDRHVPLVFWGPGIKAGHFSEKVRTVDLAPTLARLLGIEPPSDVDGTVLPRVFATN